LKAEYPLSMHFQIADQVCFAISDLRLVSNVALLAGAVCFAPAKNISKVRAISRKECLGIAPDTI